MDKKHEKNHIHHHHCGEGCNHNHDHGHDHDHDHEEPLTLDLVLDDGKEMKCEVIGIFDVEEKEYIALLPLEDDKVLLYSYEEDGEELNLDNIDDEEEFKKVSETFWEIFGEEEFHNEEDEEEEK